MRISYKGSPRFYHQESFLTEEIESIIFDDGVIRIFFEKGELFKDQNDRKSEYLLLNDYFEAEFDNRKYGFNELLYGYVIKSLMDGVAVLELSSGDLFGMDFDGKVLRFEPAPFNTENQESVFDYIGEEFFEVPFN